MYVCCVISEENGAEGKALKVTGGDRGCLGNLSLEAVADRGQTGSASREIAPDSRGKKIARGDSSPEGGCQNRDSLRYGLCVRRQALSPSCGFGDNWGRWMVKMWGM